MYIKDSKGEKSVTTTVFIMGAVSATIKLLLAGSTFGDVTIGSFTGMEAAAVYGALGGIYTLRRSKKLMGDESGGKETSK